ncbi:MAG TPA: hypothetical protein VNO33_18095 [Kofleriaceae bacterium]|nr:hypothetical protein [Kofleriaceae bacterium]
MSPRSRALALFLFAALCACGSSAAPAESPEEKGPPGPKGEAIAVLDKLAGAMRNDRAERLVDVADPVHGLTFWGQPGACAAPMFKVTHEEEGQLTALARKRVGSAPPHYFDADGYWREVAETIRAGLRVAKMNAGKYDLPPEEGLDRAPPWASLDTRNPALGEREFACLGDEADEVRKAPRSEYRFRFRAERGYSSVTVFLVEHDGELRVAHVIQVWHYDA